MNLEKEIFEIALSDIVPNRFQPREKFDELELNELAQSIKEHGIIQPIIVRKIGDKYEIIAGERRYRASQVAGKETIPALIRNIDDKETAKIALLENLQRKNLTPIEEARTYQTILKLDNITQEELANNLGKAQSTVANKLRLLNLIEEAQDALLHEKISERHARSLLNISDPIKQKELLDKVILNRMTVKQLDDEIAVINGVNKEVSVEEKEEDNALEGFVNNFISGSQEINVNPINKNIFDGLRREPEVALSKVEESQPLQDNKSMYNQITELINQQEPTSSTLQEQPKEDHPVMEDSFRLEETYIPTPNELINAPKEEIIQAPKYEGPKYDFSDLNIENPINNEEPVFNALPNELKIEDPNNNKEVSLNIANPVEIANLNEPILPIVEEQSFNPTPDNIYDMRFAINNFRQAIQNTEKFGFKVESEEFDFDNVYQIVIRIDKK